MPDPDPDPDPDTVPLPEEPVSLLESFPDEPVDDPTLLEPVADAVEFRPEVDVELRETKMPPEI